MSILINNVNIDAKEKQILVNVNCIINKSKVNVIMGPSGAGKTTLLNYLLCYNSSDQTTSGEIKQEGKPLTKELISSDFGQVTQSDILIPVLTVFETIYYNNLMHYNMTHQECEKKTHQMIDMLELTKCAQNQVGDSEKKGISGGERKRLSIALELNANVDVLVLDEPTSGLDTYSALLVMSILKNLAKKGMTIICTIHQPSSEITSMFDNLILLCDGKVTYNGDQFKSIDQFNNLMAVNDMDKIGNNANPVDVYMKWSQIGQEAQEVEAEDGVEVKESMHMKRIKVMKDTWSNHTQESIGKYIDMNQSVDKAYKSGEYTKRNSLDKFVVLVQQCFLLVQKNIPVLIIKLVQNVVVAALFLIFYSPLNNKSIGSFQDRLGLFFILLVTTTFGNIFGNLIPLILEKKIIIKDQKKGLYSPGLYLLCKNIASLPIDILSTLVLISIIYYPLQLNQNNTFQNPLMMWVTIFTMAQFGVSVAQLLISMGDKIDEIQPIVQVIIQPMIFTSGTFANLDTLWFVFQQVKQVNPMSQCMSALFKNELSDNLMCVEESPFIQAKGICTAQNLGLYDYAIWQDIGVIAGFALGYRLLGYILFQIVIARKSVQ